MGKFLPSKYEKGVLMKKRVLILLTLSIALIGCGSKKTNAENSPSPTSSFANLAATEETDEETLSRPDLIQMTFLEKNSLYLQLSDEKFAQGFDISAAEAAYQNALETSLEGESQRADQALVQAIEYLLELKW